MIQLVQYRDTGPAPTSVTPSFSIGLVDKDIPAGGTINIQKGTNIFCLSDDWIFASRNDFSGHLFAGHVDGAVLEIQLSADGITFDSYQSIPLVGLQITYISGMRLPGYIGRFILHNNSPGVIQTIQGNLQLRGR